MVTSVQQHTAGDAQLANEFGNFPLSILFSFSDTRLTNIKQLF